MSTPISAAFSTAWETFKAHAGFFIGMYVLTTVIVAIPYVITMSLSANDKSGAAFLLNIVCWLVGSAVGLGMTTIALAALDKKPLAIGMLVSNMQRFGSYFGATVLVSVIVGLGTILFIIPGVILGVRLMFWPFFMVDKNMSTMDAIKASWRMTSGRFFDAFLFVLACIGLAILGAIPLFLGLLVVVPVILLATAQFYRSMNNAPTAAVAPAPHA